MLLAADNRNPTFGDFIKNLCHLTKSPKLDIYEWFNNSALGSSFLCCVIFFVTSLVPAALLCLLSKW